MERLSKGLRAALCPPMKEELQKVLSEEAEVAQHTERALRMAIQKTIEDLGELEKSIKAENKDWQMEKEKLEAANKKARRYEEEEVRLDLLLLGHEIKMMADKAEEEKGKIASLEKSQQRVLSLLEEEKDVDELMVKDPERLKAESDNWIRWTQERVDSTLSTALTTAAVKQKWLKRLKVKAEECTVVPGMSIQEASCDTNNMPSLTDVFQSCSSKKIAKLFIRTVNLQGDIDREFQKTMDGLMAETDKQEQKIRAAELKERRQLEVKIRKELERIQKAETREQKKREKKQKKEAKKLAKKKEKEERAALDTPTRRSRFFFWRRSSESSSEK